jgi:flagellar hook-basal body complex protein FliE
MSTIPTVVITPSSVAGAYARVDQGGATGGAAGGPTGGDPAGGFSATLRRALEGAVETGHKADAQATQAITGGGNLTEVVTALTHAELALQTATAIRDRVVQAYQDIMKMPI